MIVYYISVEKRYERSQKGVFNKTERHDIKVSFNKVPDSLWIWPVHIIICMVIVEGNPFIKRLTSTSHKGLDREN